MNDASQSYLIKYSRRKTVGLYVSAEGLEVRAPYGTSKAWIQSFVDSKRHWIARNLQKAVTKHAQKPQVKLNQPLPFLGEPLILRLQVIKAPLTYHKALISDDALTFYVAEKSWLRFSAKYPQEYEETLKELFLSNLITEYLKQLAAEVISARVNYYADISGLKKRITEIRFRKTKTKWGHCSSQGQLQFNWLLASAPMEVIDYVVCHELAHLVEMNHSERFWQQIANLYPDFIQPRLWLKQNGHTLSFL